LSEQVETAGFPVFSPRWQLSSGTHFHQKKPMIYPLQKCVYQKYLKTEETFKPKIVSNVSGLYICASQFFLTNKKNGNKGQDTGAVDDLVFALWYQEHNHG